MLRLDVTSHLPLMTRPPIVVDERVVGEPTGEQSRNGGEARSRRETQNTPRAIDPNSNSKRYSSATLTSTQNSTLNTSCETLRLVENSG